MRYFLFQKFVRCTRTVNIDANVIFDISVWRSHDPQNCHKNRQSSHCFYCQVSTFYAVSEQLVVIEEAGAITRWPRPYNASIVHHATKDDWTRQKTCNNGKFLTAFYWVLYLIIEKVEGHKFIYAVVVIIIVVKQLPWGNGKGFLRTSLLKGVLNKANKNEE